MEKASPTRRARKFYCSLQDPPFALVTSVLLLIIHVCSMLL